MKKKSPYKIKITPPNWKELTAKYIRESFPKELRWKALELIEDPKVEKLLSMILEKQRSGDTVDFIEILYSMTFYAVPDPDQSPTLVKDREELRRQAQVAKQFHRRIAALVGDVSRDPNSSYHVHGLTWPSGATPKTPPMRDATILWALETVADYLKIRGSVGTRKKTPDFGKHLSYLSLEKELRKANMKGEVLYDALALAMEITHGKRIKAKSAKALLMRARSFFPEEAKRGNK